MPTLKSIMIKENSVNETCNETVKMALCKGGPTVTWHLIWKDGTYSLLKGFPSQPHSFHLSLILLFRFLKYTLDLWMRTKLFDGSCTHPSTVWQEIIRQEWAKRAEVYRDISRKMFCRKFMTLCFKVSLQKHQSFMEVLTILNLSTPFCQVFCWKTAFELFQEFECKVFPFSEHFNFF